MRVLVCGSRHFNDYEFARRVLSGFRISRIIQGAARGADSLGARYAEENGIHLDTYPALWDIHGRAAGPIRNGQMLREGAPDLVIAFWDGQSRGTANMISQAEKAGVPVKVIHVTQ